MDNLSLLCHEDIDLFLSSRIDELSTVPDRVSQISSEISGIFSHLGSQLAYIYFQSLHYDFNNNCDTARLLIKKLSEILSSYYQSQIIIKEESGLSVDKLLKEVEGHSRKQVCDSEVKELPAYFPKKCPITQAKFKDPVTQRYSFDASGCLHTFERSAISSHLSGSIRRSCPVSGCPGAVKSSNLTRDWDVLHKIYISDLIELLDE